LHKCSNLWAEKFVIQRINSDKVDRDAALAGFLLNAQVGSEKLYGFLKKFLIGLSNVEQRQRSGGRYDTQVFGGFFVTGWLSRNSDGMRWFSDAEFRRVLIFADDDLRGDVLWHVGRFDDFTEKLALLRDVWPRQLSVRTPVVVGRLCAMAFDDEPHFVELIGAILPLISHADGENFTWAILDSKADGIARNYPDQVLQLLDAVLPDAATRWPYGAGPTLERLVQTKPALAADPRMFRLKGIWDRR
jgi:hypothetical protein